jgi:hypothetical protein
MEQFRRAIGETVTLVTNDAPPGDAEKGMLALCALKQGFEHRIRGQHHIGRLAQVVGLELSAFIGLGHDSDQERGHAIGSKLAIVFALDAMCSLLGHHKQGWVPESGFTGLEAALQIREGQVKQGPCFASSTRVAKDTACHTKGGTFFPLLEKFECLTLVFIGRQQWHEIEEAFALRGVHVEQFGTLVQ